MNVRNDGLNVPRPLGTSILASTPAAAARQPAPAPSVPQDTFASVSSANVQRAAPIAGAPHGDHGKLMTEYLTGQRPIPADFEAVMGYAPVRAETAHGVRMQDPFGEASVPFKIGPDQEFKPAAKTHDLGYDLLRYFDRIGKPLDGDARKSADQLFRNDLFDFANDQSGFGARWKFRSWAQVYASAVELNSRRVGYGPP